MMQPSPSANPHVAVAFSLTAMLWAGESLGAGKSRRVSRACFCKTARLFARATCSGLRHDSGSSAQIQDFLRQQAMVVMMV
jgi:hypothetical protein